MILPDAESDGLGPKGWSLLFCELFRSDISGSLGVFGLVLTAGSTWEFGKVIPGISIEGTLSGTSKSRSASALLFVCFRVVLLYLFGVL